MRAHCALPFGTACVLAAWVNAGASSSKVSGVLEVEVCFIAVCLAQGNDADFFVGFNVNDRHNQKTQKAHADHALFTMIFTNQAG